MEAKVTVSSVKSVQSVVHNSSMRSVFPRLALMMFLEYAIRGVWMPYLASYLTSEPSRGGLGFSGVQAGWIVTFGSSVGAISAPMIMGQLADRWLNAERALAIFLFVTAALLR